jgi:predicted dehydrogenase
MSLTMKKNKVRIGVIGTGHLGKNHLRVLHELENVELVAFAEVDSEKLQEFSKLYGIKGYTDFKDLLQENLDGVSIVVPTELHYKVARFFIENEINVMVEKPVTRTLSEADKLLELSLQKNVIFQVGHIERFNPAILYLKEKVQQPRFIECLRLSTYTPRIKDVGVVLDMMIHDIDIVLSLVRSNIKNITAVGVNVISSHEDIANAHLEFENGTVVNLSSSRLSPQGLRKIRIFQENAYFSVDYAGQKVKINRLDEGKIVVEEPQFEKEEPLKSELRHFAECILQHTRPIVSGGEGRRAIEVAVEILKQIEIRNRSFAKN